MEGIPTCESTAQVLVALGALGIDVTDKRFIKGGNTVETALLSFYTAGKGFAHTPDGSTDGMANEQAFYALVSLQRQREGRPFLYDSAYIEGIGNLYEFYCGNESGWMYSVNGIFPNYGCSQHKPQDGDVICWVYTCDLGRDVGDSDWAEENSHS